MIQMLQPLGETLTRSISSPNPAERHFNWQALKEAVERMKPELGAASEATHKHGAEDTPDDSDFDRTVALGYLVESLEGLCGPHL